MMRTLPSGLEIRSALNIAFENGALGTVCCSGDTIPVVSFETIIHGSDGSIALSKEEIIHIYRDQQMNPEVTFYPSTTTDHFINVLQGREEPLCGADIAINAIENRPRGVPILPGKKNDYALI